MKIGLIGLPNSGKTTIFNALTRSTAEVTAYANTQGEPNLAAVDVMDERVTRLAEIYRPKKTTYAAIEFIDFAGLSEGSGKGDAFSGAAMGLIKRVDALALVLRNYPDGLMGAPSPLPDMEQLDLEMLMSDLVIVEKRLERIAWSYQRGQKSDALMTEEKALLKISAHLNDNRPVRTLELNSEEERAVRGFQFLTKKPMMVILNSHESHFGRNEDLLEEIGKKHEVIIRRPFRNGAVPPGRHGSADLHGGHGDREVGPGPADPVRLCPPGIHQLLHRRPRRGARLDDPPGRNRRGGGRRHPFRPLEGVYPRRVLLLQRPD